MSTFPHHVSQEELALERFGTQLALARGELEQHGLTLSRTPAERAIGDSLQTIFRLMEFAGRLAETRRAEISRCGASHVEREERDHVEVRFDSHSHPKASPDLSDREFARGLEPAHAALEPF